MSEIPQRARLTAVQLDRLRERREQGWAVHYPWASSVALTDEVLASHAEIASLKAEVERLREQLALARGDWQERLRDTTRERDEARAEAKQNEATANRLRKSWREDTAGFQQMKDVLREIESLMSRGLHSEHRKAALKIARAHLDGKGEVSDA